VGDVGGEGFVGGLVTHGVEPGAPSQIHAQRVLEVTLVEVFDEGGVAPIQGAGAAEKLEDGTHTQYLAPQGVHIQR
jgi:hypothetical protein